VDNYKIIDYYRREFKLIYIHNNVDSFTLKIVKKPNPPTKLHIRFYVLFLILAIITSLTASQISKEIILLDFLLFTFPFFFCMAFGSDVIYFNKTILNPMIINSTPVWKCTFNFNGYSNVNKNDEDCNISSKFIGLFTTNPQNNKKLSDPEVFNSKAFIPNFLNDANDENWYYWSEEVGSEEKFVLPVVISNDDKVFPLVPRKFENKACFRQKEDIDYKFDYFELNRIVDSSHWILIDHIQKNHPYASEFFDLYLDHSFIYSKLVLISGAFPVKNLKK